MSVNIRKIFIKLTSLLTACMIASSAGAVAFADIEIDKSSLPDYAVGEYDETLPRVVDEAGLLTDSEEQKLEDRIQDIIDEFEFDCVIVTVDSYRDYGSSSMEDFADDFFDYGGYGVGVEYDGIVLALSMSQRAYHFSTCGYGMVAINDSYGVYWIEDDVVGYLSSGDYYKAFSTYVDDVYDFVKEAKNNRPYSSSHRKISFKRLLSDNWFAALIAAVVITAIVAAVLKGQMKTILPQPAAKHYLKNYKERFSQDTFLYSNVTKVRRDSGGGSGGGHGGGHRSSSGRSHGGHGGHF